MRKKERFKALIEYFVNNDGPEETELIYDSPYELLVAVILSAQCTDKRVNIVTSELFKVFPTVEHLASTHFDELFPYIKSISYPNNKTKHLIGMAKMLIDQFNGEVPDNVEDLQKLPGVGRKTANVITSVIYDQPNMAVDTHVFRVSKRIGLVNQTSKTPLSVEKQLINEIPEEHISKSHHWLILHGRYICLARRPKCEQCPLSHLCLYYEKKFNTTNK